MLYGTKNIHELCFTRKENGDIGERTFEDYDVELINPPMLRLREDLSVQKLEKEKFKMSIQ